MVLFCIIGTLNNINAILAPIGFVITILGFWYTLDQVWKARTSAEAAREAALSVAKKLSRYDAISELTRAKATADEIRRYQLRKLWDALPDRYNALASILEEAEVFTQVLNDQDTKDIEVVLEFAREKEESITTGIEEKFPFNGGKLNRELGVCTKLLGAILGRLKQELEAKHGSD